MNIVENIISQVVEEQQRIPYKGITVNTVKTLLLLMSESISVYASTSTEFTIDEHKVIVDLEQKYFLANNFSISTN